MTVKNFKWEVQIMQRRKTTPLPALSFINVASSLCLVFMICCLSADAQDSVTTTGEDNRPETSKQAVVKVMSFNLRFGTANDGPNRWENRTELVKTAVERNSPDLLGTQETLPFQAEFVSKHFPEFERVGRSREPDNANGEQCALFFRKERFDKLAEGHFWLSESPDLPGSKSWDSSLPRMATWVRLWDRQAKRSIFFLNTHFDHRGETARQESASLIRNKVNQLADGAAVIITGDFNAGGSSIAHQRLIESAKQVQLVDSFEQKHETNQERSGTFNGFQGKQDGARIDWIVVDGPSFQIEKSEIETFNMEGRYPSDHFPVTAILIWKNKP